MSTDAVTRNTVRMILLDQESNILLFKIDDPHVSEPGKGRKKPFWVTPGGKIEEAETERQALERELFEETGIKATDALFGPCVGEGTSELLWKGRLTRLVERFFLVQVKHSHVSPEHREDEEAKAIKEGKWFSLEDLDISREWLIPKDLPKLFADILAGDTRTKKIDLSAPEGLYEQA